MNSTAVSILWGKEMHLRLCIAPPLHGSDIRKKGCSMPGCCVENRLGFQCASRKEDTVAHVRRNPSRQNAENVLRIIVKIVIVLQNCMGIFSLRIRVSFPLVPEFFKFFQLDD